MPTYEYHCEKCKKTFEAYQSMKDPALSTCLKDLCRQKSWGKGKVKRLLGRGGGLLFKGAGFYATDYRSPGYKASEKKESGDGQSKSETKKSEGKPEATGKPDAAGKAEKADKPESSGAAKSAGKPKKPSDS
ncbi:MAG: zinc ribbon domain-containing protein [Verrucomicrobiota bacterium]|nr:zinc ribbon domain-containing protein [Verrucomicrobiota bacterium]